jgi:hypothetical protein
MDGKFPFEGIFNDFAIYNNTNVFQNKIKAEF